MASNRVWNLVYVLGNTSRVVGDAANPQDRTAALSGAESIATKNGWRVWVEHHESGKRIFESEAERQFKREAEAKRIIEFAERNVPGFR